MPTGRPTRDHSVTTPSMFQRFGQWSIVVLAGAMFWILLTLAAVWQGVFIALFFPAGWCLYVAIRQFRLLQATRNASRGRKAALRA